jgi:uncharacterized OsmC-like protein
MKPNLQAVQKFVSEVQKDPTLAVKTKAVTGDANFAENQPHFSAMLEFPNGKLTLDSDQPPFLGGGGTAPDPLLYCLFGTASCFVGTMMLVIAQRGLKVDSLRITAQNQVNLRLPLGLSQEPIVEGVWLKMEYTGRATQSEMDSVVQEALDTCPGAYCLRHPIPLTAEIRKA